MVSYGKINKKVKRNCIYIKKFKGIKRRIGLRIIERNVVGKKKKNIYMDFEIYEKVDSFNI